MTVEFIFQTCYITGAFSSLMHVSSSADFG